MVDWDQYDVGDNKLMQQVALRFYCRHLVCLAIAYHPIDKEGKPSGDAKALSFSGFLLTVRGVWCLVTAGHITEKLDKHLSEKTIKLTNCVIIDGWGLDAKHKVPFPFDYEGSSRISVVDGKYGLDFALIQLSSHYQRLLEANKVLPISEENWMHQDSVNLDEHFVLGLPTELMTHTEHQGKQSLHPSPSIIPVAKIDQAPVGYETHYPRFIGKIFDNVSGDMDGMSGGPIIGIGTSKDGNRRYWIVAIQSAWIPSKRIIFGCPVPVFAKIVEYKLQSLETESDSDEDNLNAQNRD